MALPGCRKVAGEIIGNTAGSSPYGDGAGRIAGRVFAAVRCGVIFRNSYTCRPRLGWNRAGSTPQMYSVDCMERIEPSVSREHE